MNLTTILAAIGLGDGQGNTSSTRVILMLGAIVLMLPKIVTGLHGLPVTIDDNDLKMFGIILGGGIGKTIAEGKTETTTPKVN